MANIWTPEAERLTPSGTPGNLMGGGAKAILHVTVSGSGGSNFAAMHRVLIGKQAEPHYLYDPITDRLGQYFPLNRSSRSLGTGSGPVSCNRAGSRLIQIEVVAWPGSADGAPRNSAPTTKGGFTAIWTPGPNFRAMMRDIRANGVPDRFPLGSTAPGATRASFSSYQSGSGWYGHCHVPYQSHWDPGVIDQAAFFAAGSASTIAPTGGLTVADINTILDAIAALDRKEADRYSVSTGRYQWEAGVLTGIAAKVGTPVDEAAVAQQVLAGLAPQVADAIKAAVDAGVPTDELADAVVAKLGARLNPPKPAA